MTRPLLLCLAVILFHWRLVFSSEYTWLESPGIFEHFLPLMQFQAGELHKWRLPIFDPYSPGGQPLLGFGSGVTSIWYLPHTLLLALPLDHGWLRQTPLHWYFVLTQCAMAVAMFSFVRRRLYLSDGAAFVSGLAYALGVLSTAGPDPQVLQASIWVPLALAARPGWTRALYLGLIWLPGGLYVPLATYAAIAIMAFTRQPNWRECLRNGLTGLALAAIVIVPGFAFFGNLPPLPTLSGGIAALPVLGIFGWYIGLRRPQVRTFLLPTAVAGILHPALLIFSLSASLAIVLDDSGTIRAAARRWAGLVWILAGSILAWGLVPWLQFDQLPPIEPVALPCLLAAGAALLLWLRPEPRRAFFFAAVLVLADSSRGQLPSRWQSRHDTTRPRKLNQLAQATSQVIYLRQFQERRPKVWVDPSEVPYAFGPWWGVETASREHADYRISIRPAPGFEKVLYSGDDGLKVFASTAAGTVSCSPIVRAGALTPNRRSFETTAPCAFGFDTGLDSFAGWQVKVDGKSVEYPQRSLPLPAGDHKVELEFLPISWIAGALISAIGVLYIFRLAWRQPFKL